MKESVNSVITKDSDDVMRKMPDEGDEYGVMSTLIDAHDNDDDDTSINHNSSREESFDHLESTNVSEDENNVASFENLEPLLFEGSTTNQKDFMYGLMALKIKHNASNSLMNDILDYFGTVLPKPNSCPKSFTKFNKHLVNENEIEYFGICSSCKSISGPFPDESKQSCTCTCLQNGRLMSFVRLDIDSQLIKILSCKKRMDQIIKSNVLAQEKTTCIQDSIHASIYQIRSENKLPGACLVSLNLNTDGCPLIKSKNYSMWPLLATITELDPISRENFDNMIILGFYLVLTFF